MDIDKLKAGSTPDEKINAIVEFLEEFQNQYDFDITHIGSTNLTATGAGEIMYSIMDAVKKDRKLKAKMKEFILWLIS